MTSSSSSTSASKASKCIVRGCGGKYKRNAFTVPLDPTLRMEWLKLVKREDLFNRVNKNNKFIRGFICDFHFAESDILSDYEISINGVLIKMPRGKKMLKNGAKPSLFLTAKEIKLWEIENQIHLDQMVPPLEPQLVAQVNPCPAVEVQLQADQLIGVNSDLNIQPEDGFCETKESAYHIQILKVTTADLKASNNCVAMPPPQGLLFSDLDTMGHDLNTTATDSDDVQSNPASFTTNLQVDSVQGTDCRSNSSAEVPTSQCAISPQGSNSNTRYQQSTSTNSSSPSISTNKIIGNSDFPGGSKLTHGIRKNCFNKRNTRNIFHKNKHTDISVKKKQQIAQSELYKPKPYKPYIASQILFENLSYAELYKYWKYSFNLPTCQWAIHFSPENKYLIFSHESLELYQPKIVKSICFEENSLNPEICIRGNPFKFSTPPRLKYLSDVESLVFRVDKISPCAGTGLRLLDASPRCLGFAEAVDIDGKSRCGDCKLLRWATLMEHPATPPAAKKPKTPGPGEEPAQVIARQEARIKSLLEQRTMLRRKLQKERDQSRAVACTTLEGALRQLPATTQLQVRQLLHAAKGFH